MSQNGIYGASLAEWEQLSLFLGITQDLLPIVSDPTAEKLEGSSVQTPGKVPSHFDSKGNKWFGMKKWTSHVTTQADIAKWSKDNRHGICIQTRNVRAIDVDVDDFDTALDVEDFLKARIHYAPIRRRGNSTKFLIPVIIHGDFTKRRFAATGGAIEFLATGQQFVAVGTHPSGVKYEWDGGLPDFLPELTPAQFEALWAKLHTKFGTGTSVTLVGSKNLPKARNAADGLNDPVADYLHAEWPVFDTGRDGRIDIECPFKSGHSTDSGPTSTSYYPAGVGGYSRGHFKCLHASCAHRTDADFLEATGYQQFRYEEIIDEFDEVEVIPPQGRVLDQEGNEIDKSKLADFSQVLRKRSSKNDKIKPTRELVSIAVRCSDHTGWPVGFDDFKSEYSVNIGGVWRPMKDSDFHNIAVDLERESGGIRFEHVPKELLRDCVMSVAEEQQFDSAQNWLNSRKAPAKKVKRVETFLRDFMGAEDTPYTRAVSRYFWTAMAGRILQPGIKADMVPVAVGKQGARKTSLLSAIVPFLDMFHELDLSKKDDDISRELRGKVLSEFGELKGIAQRFLEHTKAFISRTREEWTPKYKEFTFRYMRRCIFFGTTNDDEPLPDDETGQRRWLPFRVIEGRQCSVEEFVALRDEFWFEAKEMFLEYGVMWYEAEKLAGNEHATFEKEDTWMEPIHQYLFDAEMGEEPAIKNPNGVSLFEVLRVGLCIAPKESTRADELRAGRCLKRLGLHKAKRNNKRVWVLKV